MPGMMRSADMGSDKPSHTPAIDEGEEGGEAGRSQHAAQAQGPRIVEGKNPHAQQSAHDGGQGAQGRDKSGVTGSRFRSIDESLHDEPDEAPHDDPDADTDPVFHWIPYGGVHCEGPAGNVPGLFPWNQSGQAVGLTTMPLET